MWGTVSKALEKSRRRTFICLWLFLEEAQSWTASMSWVWQESPVFGIHAGDGV